MRIFRAIKTDQSLLKDQRGATAIEYALVASLISVAAITAYHNLGAKVFDNFNTVDQNLKSAI